MLSILSDHDDLMGTWHISQFCFATVVSPKSLVQRESYQHPNERKKPFHDNLITARKRSLGQGNTFTGVCLSIGVCDRHPPRQASPPQGRPPYPPNRRPLKRAVRILLKCILIFTISPLTILIVNEIAGVSWPYHGFTGSRLQRVRLTAIFKSSVATSTHL